MQSRFFISIGCLCVALVVAVQATDPVRVQSPKKMSADNDLPKTFEEKKKIAVGMKKISKQLDVKCAYCHTDAERGLKEGDYTLLTKEGEYAHEVMFPLSDQYKVECSFCHTGGSDMTAAGERSHQDLRFMKKYNRNHKQALACANCHIPGGAGIEFKNLTPLAHKLMPSK